MNLLLIKKNCWTVLLGLLLSCPFLTAQDRIIYQYDQAGNRIGRALNTITLRSDTLSGEETTYMEVIEDMEIRIYPNPTDGILFVEIRNLPDNTLADMTLYALSGNRISRKEEVDFSAEFDLTDQPPGVYILRIIAGDQQTEWKIIKK